MPTEREVAGRATGENFPVALRLLPADIRADLLAVYSFARLVDEFGDSYEGDRLAALGGVEAALTAALDTPPPSSRDGAGAAPGPVGPICRRVADVTRRRAMDPAPLFRLIAANRTDQVKSSYATFADLLGYCELSANPVGRLVLGVFGATDEERVRRSDDVCSGLQLAEHWQDVAEDAAAGRVYLPGEDLDRFGVERAELTAGPPATARLRALMAFEADRARRLIDSGVPLVRSLRGWARVAVGGYVAGGYAALDALAGAGFDPLGGAPHPTKARTAAHALRLLSGRRQWVRA